MARTLPKGWSYRELGDLVRISSGGTPARSNAGYWGGSMPWITAKDLKVFDLQDSQERLTDAGAERASVAPENTVLMLVRGMGLFKGIPIGVTSRPMAFNQDIKALHPKEDITARFLGYALQGQRHYLMGNVDQAGHGTGRLPTSVVEELPLPVPKKLDEQRRIVCVLDAAKQLENLSDEVYRKRRALAAAKFVEVTKAAGGDSVKLSDIVSINADSLPNSTDPDREIQYFDVSSDGDHEVSGRMRFSQAPSRARRLAEAGDVVYATIRPLLRRLFIAEDRPDAVYSTGYAVMSGPEDITRYLYHALTTEAVERQVHAFSTGTGYPAISAGDLGDVKLRLPNKTSRIAIANMADAMFKQAEIHRRIAEGAGLRHRVLMQQLLTGQHRLTRDLPGMEPGDV